MAKDRHGFVRLLELLDLLSRQLDIDRRVWLKIMSVVAPRQKRKRRRPVLGTALTDQFFQFVKGGGADDGRSDD